MTIDMKPGRYVVAVSGGVDSVSLLHMLHNQSDLDLIVAHYDHGIRQNSVADRQFVQALAKKYELPFEYEEGHLGKAASEATARQARYDFLRRIQKIKDAQAIITAHHQDDLLETAILNMLRGTGRKGLTALKSHDDVTRPLLKVPKTEILNYAKVHKLAWQEDSTNEDLIYMRNYIRHKLLTRLSDKDRSRLGKILTGLAVTNAELDGLLAELIKQQPIANQLDRQWFNQLPHDVAKEVLADWLRANQLRGFDRKTLERLVVAAKTAVAGKTFPVEAGHNMQVGKDHLVLA